MTLDIPHNEYTFAAENIAKKLLEEFGHKCYWGGTYSNKWLCCDDKVKFCMILQDGTIVTLFDNTAKG